MLTTMMGGRWEYRTLGSERNSGVFYDKRMRIKGNTGTQKPETEAGRKPPPSPPFSLSMAESVLLFSAPTLWYF